MGITFSWAMHCRILGAPYSPPMQEARDEMYSPSKNKKPTKDTWRKQRECKADYIILERPFSSLKYMYFKRSQIFRSIGK